MASKIFVVNSADHSIASWYLHTVVNDIKWFILNLIRTMEAKLAKSKKTYQPLHGLAPLTWMFQQSLRYSGSY